MKNIFFEKIDNSESLKLNELTHGKFCHRGKTVFFLFKNIKTKCVFVCFLLLLFQFIAISEATAKTPGWIKDIGRNIKENAKRQVHNNEILTDCTARLIQASSRSEVMRIWSMYKGIDINMFVPNQKYELPIFVCVGMVNHSSDAVAAVLSLGARVNAIINNQFPSLYYVLAANDSPAVIEAFLRAGADANSNINGITPLLFAAAKKVSPEIIRVLIKYGARDANLEAAVANSQRST